MDSFTEDELHRIFIKRDSQLRSTILLPLLIFAKHRERFQYSLMTSVSIRNRLLGDFLLEYNNTGW
jgi:hypothetical protein